MFFATSLITSIVAGLIGVHNFIPGPEYGTTQAAWRSVLTEADKLCELHTEVAEKLMTNVYLQIKQWNKENYHKTMMNFRESKDKDDNFRRVCMNLGVN